MDYYLLLFLSLVYYIIYLQSINTFMKSLVTTCEYIYNSQQYNINNTYYRLTCYSCYAAMLQSPVEDFGDLNKIKNVVLLVLNENFRNGIA